ncbi:MAG: response regulator [Proteobacteria bacterium]|nr:response regulator [Pseudomonadota bacterium]
MGKTKILVVDDEERLTKMVKLNLEQTGDYEIRTENLATNALNAAREFKPDLIILDIMMPDISGDVIAQQLLDDEELNDIKIIFLTALVTKGEIKSKGSEIAGRTFLAKPVKIDELITCIEEQLEK